MGDNFFIILYGRILLKSNEAGVFKECLFGETISEESILYN